ncbi:MAG TPA: MBL fold metallo-hydrolase [bacterium]|nr:MBL fold metallo-hydrolase [bacterium]
MAAKDLMKAGVDVWATRETLDAANLFGHRAQEITPMRQTKIGSWQVKPFLLHHDVQCVGLLLNSCATNESALWACDTQFVHNRFEGKFNIIAIECNYALDILRSNLESGALGIEAARRAIKNHMSLSTCIEFLKANDMAKVQEIHLLHLSDGNSDAERFKMEIQSLTARPVWIGG